MVKRMKFDESGDTDDLQALFDSIASAPAKPRLEVVDSAGGEGDSDDLQSLFDAVASQFDDLPAAVSGEDAQEPGDDAVYTRIGHMTRQVHDTLQALGYDQALQEAAQAVPDARQRLNYIAQMTEQAASRVLNAADIAQPIQHSLGKGAAGLQAKWDRLYANELGVDEFKALAAETRSFLGSVAEGSRATHAQLLEIVMAQDFQDLTGQVIKKVVAMAQQLETQLISVLIEAMPDEKRTEKLADKHAGLMNGPVISAEDRDDVVSSQEQVDDLLESLGF
jgi:chemotaxis protein CheZ